MKVNSIDINGLDVTVEHISRRRAYLLCPFHEDTNPSLEVQLTGEYAGTYTCWGCGARGTALGWKSLGAYPDTEEMVVNWGLKQLHFESKLKSNKSKLSALSEEWDVREASLRAFGLGYTGLSYTFPVYSFDLKITGIQRRTPDGSKYYYSGSSVGMFLPNDIVNKEIEYADTIVICEGASDTVHVHDRLLGVRCLKIIGRSSCSSSTREIVSLLTKMEKVKRTIIVADTGNNDEIQGARDLRTSIRNSVNPRPLCSIYFPKSGKDIREDHWKYGNDTRTCLGEFSGLW